MVPDPTDEAVGVVGLPTDAAVERILAADETRDPDEVRSLLDHATANGRVTRDGIDETVSDVSKRLATTETRVELARNAYSDVQSASDTVADVDIVAARLERYESTLDSIESRVREIGRDLQQASNPEDDPDAVFEAVRTLREVATGADEIQRRADELQFDLEDFEAWLESAERRRDAFEEDIAAVADVLSSAAERTNNLDEASWVEALLQVELVPVLAADLRAELSDLRTMATRRDDLEDWGAGFDARIEELVSRADEIRTELEEVGEAEWRATHDERLTAFERSLADFEPPIEWGAVYAEFERASTLHEPSL